MDLSLVAGTGGLGLESMPPVPNITSKIWPPRSATVPSLPQSQSRDHVGVGSGRLVHMDVSQVIQTLDREREYIDRQIKSLRERKSEIDTTISVLQALEKKLATAEQGDSVGRVDQPVPEEPSGELVPAHPGRDGPQSVLRRLMHKRPGVELDSKSAHALLVEEGWESRSKDPVNVVRSALAVLASQGEIAKRGRGRYVYDPDQQKPAVTGEQPDSPGFTGRLDLMAPANGSADTAAVYRPVSTYAAVSDRASFEPFPARPVADGESGE